MATLADIAKGVEGVEKSQGQILTSVEELKAEDAKNKARLEALEEKNLSSGAPAAGLSGQGEKFEKSFSILDMFKKVANKGLDNPSQLAYPDENREKIMSGSVASDGGYTVPPQFAAELIERLKAAQVLAAAGMRTFNVDAGFGTVNMPRLTSGMTHAEYGENATPAVSTPQVDLIVASAKRIAGVVEISNDLLMMNGVGLDEALLRDFTEDGALRADILGLRGTGTSFEPRGILNTPGIGSVTNGANGGPVSISKLLELQRKIAENNARMVSPGYIMHARGLYQSYDIQENSQHVWPSVHFAPGMDQLPRTSLLGMPWQVSNQLPVDGTKGTGTELTEIYFGDWAELIQVRWGELTVKTSTEATHPTTGRSAFHNNLTVFLVEQKIDYVVRHPESFAVGTDFESV